MRWGVTALSVLLEPAITVRVMGALAAVPFTASWRPPGLVWKVSCTVFGSSRTAVVEVSPPYDGPGQPTAVAAANIAFELLTLDVLARVEAE